MAVSGRKFGGFKDTLSICTAEEFDNCCEPCKHLGRSVEAKGFCVDCKKNLCKRCVDGHQGLKLCRHHQILDQPQKVPQKTTSGIDELQDCSEYCNIHKKEILMFFCQDHDKVGCSDCMTLDRRTCRIDYIPDICSGTLTSKEFGGALQKLSATINEVDSVLNISQKQKEENKTNTVALLQEIEKYQKKINDRIEQLKQQLVEEANTFKMNRDRDADKIADTCADVSSELKQIRAALQDCQAKKLDAQAFVTMKRVQSILDTTNIPIYRNKVTSVFTNILFAPNDQLENILTQTNALGRLLLNASDDDKLTFHIDETSNADVKIGKETKVGIHSIERMFSIEVIQCDESRPSITGCAMISADRLLLADCENSKLKVVNIDTRSVVEDMGLESKPWAITVLPQDQAAITLPHNKEILILETAGKLSRIRRLQVGRRCYGLVNHEDHMYVVCQKPNSLLILDMRGNIQRDIELKAALDQNFITPLCIVVSIDGQKLYISDWKSHSVTSLSLQGEVTGVYKHNKLLGPRGIVVLVDGSLLVCCAESGTIHQVSADLMQGRTLTTGVADVESICYDAGNSQIYVGRDDSLRNQIEVFRIQ